MTDTDASTNEIERDLAQTRARLDATIDALQQRLSPGEMVDQAIGYVKESGGGEFGRAGRRRAPRRAGSRRHSPC